VLGEDRIGGDPAEHGRQVYGVGAGPEGHFMVALAVAPAVASGDLFVDLSPAEWRTLSRIKRGAGRAAREPATSASHPLKGQDSNLISAYSAASFSTSTGRKVYVS
jgi:hypothetical protein